MNPGNVCEHLEIRHIDHPQPFKYMFELQHKLQDRLGAGLKPDDTLQEVVSKIIYWNYCMQGEVVELAEWLNSTNYNKTEAWMEVVDILHFAMNIGIMLDINADSLEKELQCFIWTSAVNDNIEIYQAILDLFSQVTYVIDVLPWKSWKTYPEYVDGRDAARSIFPQMVMGVLRLGCVLGMSKQDIVNYYCSKNLENHARQDRGY